MKLETLEYEPLPDQPPWLIGKWPALAASFSITAEEAVKWHHALAGQGRPWLVIRRIHSVAPMWGDGATPDDIMEWTFPKLAAALAVPEKDLRRDLASAVEFWQKVRHATPADPAADDGTGVKTVDGLPDFSFSRELADEDVNRLLDQLRFGSVRNPADRQYVARRIIELRGLLSDPNTRESARQLIVMEMNLTAYESTLLSARDRQASIQKTVENHGGAMEQKTAKELLDLADGVARTEKALKELQVRYMEAADRMSTESREESAVRQVALGTISHLTEAHRRYYAKGDRTLIDGFFPADELVWLTTALEMRPAQYRPDIVLRLREAMEPQNLWGPDYQPTVIQRDACRRLSAIVRAFAESEEPGPDTIPGVDDVSPAESEEADAFAADDPPATGPSPSDSAADDSVPLRFLPDEPEQEEDPEDNSVIVVG